MDDLAKPDTIEYEERLLEYGLERSLDQVLKGEAVIKYEYDYVTISDREAFINVEGKNLEKLNEAGAEGWRFTGHAEDTGTGMRYLMEREIPRPLPKLGPGPEEGRPWRQGDRL